MRKIKVCFVASGNGSNISSLATACFRSGWYPCKASLVICDRPNLGAEDAADCFLLPLEIVNRYENGDKTKPLPLEVFEHNLDKTLRQYEIDLICLTGFKFLLSAEFVSKWRNRILNAHPSLLPAFPGFSPYKKIKESGVKISGSTIHLVDEGMDTGTILEQGSFEIGEKESERDIKEKTLEVEKIIYPRALKWYAIKNSRLVLDV